MRIGASAQAPPGATTPTPGIGRRLVCMGYESLLVFGVVFLASLPFLGAAGIGAGGWMRHAYQGWLFLVLGVYFVGAWCRRGQTLAMKTWKLRVVGAHGARITLRQAALRYVCAWPCLLLFGIGILYAPFDRERRFLQDRLAGTKIVATP